MKKLILLLTICMLISSCGLFRKTIKKIDSSEHIIKKEEFRESSKRESEVSSEFSERKENEFLTERDQRNLDSQTSIEADEIIVDKIGNLSAKGSVKLINSKKDRGKSKKDINKAVESNISENGNKLLSEELKGKIKEGNKSKVVNKNTVIEPEGSNFIWFVLAGLIFVIGIIWYLKRK